MNKARIAQLGAVILIGGAVTLIAAAPAIYVCYQARRVANSFVKNADIKIANDTSIADSTRRLAEAAERAYPIREGSVKLGKVWLDGAYRPCMDSRLNETACQEAPR